MAINPEQWLVGALGLVACAALILWLKSRTRLKVLSAESAQLQWQLNAAQANAENLQADSARLLAEMHDWQTQAKVVQAEKQNLIEAHSKLEEETARVRKELSSEFKLMAQKLLEEKTNQLQKEGVEGLANTLNPLRQQLSDFRNKVEDVHEKQVRDRATLQAEINQLKQLNQRLSNEAENLTNALKGNKKLQGNWGEVVLERVLEQSGLRKGHEYETQVNLKDEDGQRRLPDVIVHLPDNRDVVVDSKVSLNAYLEAMSAEDEETRKIALATHVRSVSAHIDDLGAKNYESLIGLRTLDFVLMFIPIESAFMSAFEHDPDLFRRAYDRGVIVVSPTTLLATLKTVQTLWRYEQQNKNAEEIALQAGRLFDQVLLFVESLDEVEKHFSKAQEALLQSKSRLSSGRGNLISRINRLSDLGARHKKQVPAQHQIYDDSDAVESASVRDPAERTELLRHDDSTDKA